MKCLIPADCCPFLQKALALIKFQFNLTTLKAAGIKQLCTTCGILIIGVLFSVSAYGQNYIELEARFSPVFADSAYFLHEWALPATIQVFSRDEELPPRFWEFQPVSGTIRFSAQLFTEYSSIDTLTVLYKAYPLTLRRSYQNRVAIALDSSLLAHPDSLEQGLDAQRPPVYDESKLMQSGSLSRGIIVGTNQDFSLESGLNFELHGPITDNININASLTDQNLPIQPDGTTQNLREFDKVFIQVEAPNSALEMGDVDISLEQSTFARLNRRLQGAVGYTDSPFGDYRAAASVVRGTYKTMRFNGEDGVQGPYRLTGTNDEEFVIVLAGTERVFINGQRVRRGAEYDYVIDYGLGEIFFTSNLLIKDETRIAVEYEYVEQNFNRTLLAGEGSTSFFGGRLQIGVTAIRQADGNSLLSQRALTQDDIDILRMAGDNPQLAIASGARIAAEHEKEEFVLYAQADTVVDGTTHTIYRHIPGSPEAIYRVVFSKVGNRQGSYRRISGTVNGLLYEWVGPQNGDYEPFQELPAPQEQQMVALRGRYHITDKFEFFGETAASSFDKNRFSDLDDDDNTDMAYELGFRLNNVKSPIGRMNASAMRRYSGGNFEFFERTRDIEFDRKWNITRTEQSREAINEVLFSLRPAGQTNLGVEMGYVERDDFLGIRQGAFIQSNEPGIINLDYRQDYVLSEDDSLFTRGEWFRHKGMLSRDFSISNWSITPYISLDQEKRIQRHTLSDSLSANSQQFHELGPGLRFTLPAPGLTFDASLMYRSQSSPYQNALTQEYQALEHRYQVAYTPSLYFGTTNEVRFRIKDYESDFSQLQTNSRSLFLKSVTNYRAKNEFIEGELFYQANTQRQAVLQEVFIKVGAAHGQYVWRDINEDGVQQLDEFFPELTPNEGTYIREFLPSDELFPVVFLNLRTFNTIKPFTLFLDDDDHWMSGVALRSRISISENSTTSNLADVYLLKLNTFRNDTNTVQGHINWEKELDVLQNHERADLRLTYSENRALNQRTTESVSTYAGIWQFYGSLHVAERTTAQLRALNGIQKTASTRLQSRNYNIKSYSITPGVEITINRSWQTGIHLSYIQKEDRFPAEHVQARILKFANTHRAFLWKKLQTDFRLEYRTTQVKGNSSVYGTFELTDGLGAGNNLLWAFNSTYRVNKLIRFSLNYDGRTAENLPVIHTIKLVMSAVF